MNPFFFILVCCGLFFTATSDAAFTVKNGKLVDVEEIPTMAVDKHFEAGTDAMEKKEWKEAAKQYRIVALNFPHSPYGPEAAFFMGVCYYNLEEYDYANDAFTQYLKLHNNPKFFEEAIGYKFSIAEQFASGARRHFLGTKQLPKWASGRTLSIKIYDEVIASLPSHDYAAHALYSKGCLLRRIEQYRESVEAFQMLIRRFPKHELAPEAFVAITNVYLDLCKYEFQNPDILALAQVSARKFKEEFPKDERVEIAEKNVMIIKEIYATGLYETGQFYERVKQPNASAIYYLNTITQFPDTSVAELCRQRLEVIKPTSS